MYNLASIYSIITWNKVCYQPGGGGGIPSDVGDDKLLLMHHKKIDNVDIGVRCIGTFMVKIDPMKWYNININSELYIALSNKKA